ncbi:MAG: hypothetical protein AB8B99_06115 [Phormidesmis sp.]
MKWFPLASTLFMLSLPIVCAGSQLPANALPCNPEDLGGHWENVDAR